MHFFTAPGLELVALSFDGISLESSSPRCLLSRDKEIMVGRSQDNHMVLDDPSRCVSRFQAKLLLLEDDTVMFKNISASVSVFINDSELLPGQSQVVSGADKILIGRYLVGLKVIEAPLPENHNVTEIYGGASRRDDFSASNSAASDTYIPDDFDIFAEPQDDADAASKPFDLSELSASEARSAESLITGLDPLHGAAPPAAHPGSQGDGLIGALAEPSDPLAMFTEQGVHNSELEQMFGAASQADHDPELAMAFTAPAPRKNPDSTLAELVAQPQSPLAAPLADTKPEPKHVQAPVQKQETAAYAAQQSAPAAGAAPSDTLRRVFSEASGVELNHLPEFDEDFVATLGRLLSRLSAGTVEMIHARSVTKHEMRANVTIIAAEGNNPLKFAPDAQSALTQLIAPTFSGFKDPVHAIDEAFEDLAAHQVGLMMGARAAVYEVVNKFSPERLGRYLSSNQVLDSILPMSRKSRLWELYEANYAELAGDAKEDFEVLFQQAFADAYEREVERVQEARR